MSPRWPPLVAFAAAFLLAAVTAWRAPSELQGDERGFAAYAPMQAEMYVACLGGAREACRDPRWDVAHQGYCSASPKLGMFVLGGLDHATRWLPPQRRVPARRLGMVGLAGLCAALLATLARRAGGPLGGLLAVGLLLAHPVFRAASAALLPDLPLLVLALAALLAFDTGLEARPGWRRAILLLAAGALCGLALACKLYALALYPAMAALLWSHRRALGASGLGLAGLGLLLGVALFAALDPRFWWEPGVALQAMTVSHVESLGGVVLAPTTGGLAWLWVPFSLPLPALDARTQLADLGPGWSLAVGAVIGLLGAACAVLRRRWLPVAWLAATILLCAWVISRFPPSWLYARAFLLPAVAFCWLGGLADVRALRGRVLAGRRVD